MFIDQGGNQKQVCWYTPHIFLYAVFVSQAFKLDM